MMYFDEYGDRKNPTIILVHGAAATDTFAGQYRFQDQYHLVVPHLYGSGKEVEERYEPEKTVEAIVRIIKSLGKEKVLLMGHSLGGELAVALAAKHEELFSGAVFLSAWVCATEKSIALFRRMAKITCKTLKWGWLVRWQAKHWNYNQEQAEFMVQYARKITPEQYVAWFTDRVYLDELPEYASVKIPMLAICGTKEVKEMKKSLEELGRRNGNCRTLLLEGVNHDFPLRNMDRLNPILLDFFEKVEGKRSAL